MDYVILVVVFKLYEASYGKTVRLGMLGIFSVPVGCF